MNWKLLVILLMTLGHAYRMVLHFVSRRSAKNPTPANVADVYDAETYQRWQKYSAEKNRLSIFSTLLSFAVTLLLLALDAHATFASLFPANVYVQLLAVILFQTLVETLADVGLSYVDTMVIEQKYGFNRSTMKTFVIDQIRNFIINILLSALLMCLLALIYRALGDWVVLLFAG
ncbi:MAG: hypothetical protein IJ343_13000, partial [Clostridia bacterium]|nr:hypothetical protein [Clostridia bacterium]